MASIRENGASRNGEGETGVDTKRTLAQAAGRWRGCTARRRSSRRCGAAGDTASAGAPRVLLVSSQRKDRSSPYTSLACELACERVWSIFSLQVAIVVGVGSVGM